MLKTLYNQGLSDREIGEVLGKSHSWVYLERVKLGLKTNHPKEPNAHYSKALKPEQCEEMHKFLSILSTGARMAHEQGTRPDITAYINEWRGYKTTDSERKANREYMRRRQKE